MVVLLKTEETHHENGETSSLCTWNNHRKPPVAEAETENDETSNVVDETEAKSRLLTPAQPQLCSEQSNTPSSFLDLRSEP